MRRVLPGTVTPSDDFAGERILKDVRGFTAGELANAKAAHLGVEHENVAAALRHHQLVGIPLVESRHSHFLCGTSA